MDTYVHTYIYNRITTTTPPPDPPTQQRHISYAMPFLPPLWFIHFYFQIFITLLLLPKISLSSYMACSNPNNKNKNKNKLISSSSLLLSGRAIFDQTTTTTNTTFVQADPSNFRAVVQSLTRSTQLHPSSTQKLPVTVPAKPNSGEMGTRRPGFKLHERRKSAKKLEMIKCRVGSSISGSPRQREFGGEMMMVSPVSTLDLFARGSPKSPLEEEEEERAIIAEKGFYLHPRSPLSTPRSGGSELQLLPLFPLHSPTKWFYLFIVFYYIILF